MGKSRYKKLSCFEIVIGASAVLVSLCALFVSISQMKLMQEQMHQSVLPRIDIAFSENPKNMNISVINCGIGPAEIVSAKVEYNSVTIASWEELIQMMSQGSLKTCDFTASKLKNRMLVPMQMFPILTIRDEKFHKLLSANKEKVKITLYYKSLYDDYFVVCRENLTVSSSIINKSVDGVTIPKIEVFQR